MKVVLAHSKHLEEVSALFDHIACSTNSLLI
jgi:hypothetical protein